MQIIDCTFEQHGPAILSILNEAIVHSTARWEYSPWTLEMMFEWFRVKQSTPLPQERMFPSQGNVERSPASEPKVGLPVIGIVDGAGELLGYGSFAQFRPFAAYLYSVEHSIYVRSDARRKGVGEQILLRLMELAARQNFRLMVAGIDSTNAASIRLHEKHQFQLSGIIPQAGYKFGKWLDLCFYHRLLECKMQPNDSVY